MSNTVCLFTGSFNPPCGHHQEAARLLASAFGDVRVIPCGFRPDQPHANEVQPTLRAALADIAFGRLPGVTVDHSDIESNTFTPSIDLEARFAPHGEVWHGVWYDMVEGGAAGEAGVQTRWTNGREAWDALRFVVLKRTSDTVVAADLPPRSRVIEVPNWWYSRDVRLTIYSGETPPPEVMDPAVLAYVRRYSLYSLKPPTTRAPLDTRGLKYKVIADAWNKDAPAIIERLKPITTDTNPDAFLVLGGDGTMLRAIHEHWPLRLPFVGLNLGHLGFLSNEAAELIGGGGDPVTRLAPDELIVRRLPLLHVTLELEDGTSVTGLSFNDAWVERATGQTAHVRVLLNGEERLDRVVCDGMLVSTAAGSTAYAASMGAAPILADTPTWLLVGSNVMRPISWKSAYLQMDAEVRIENVERQRRPLNGFVFDKPVGGVTAMTARVSRAATAELAFTPAHDLASKLTDQQFGKVKSMERVKKGY